MLNEALSVEPAPVTRVYVKVLPLSLPRSDEAPGGLAFVLLLLTGGSDEAIAEAAGIAEEAIRPVAVQSAPEPAPAVAEEEERSLEVKVRSV